MAIQAQDTTKLSQIVRDSRIQGGEPVVGATRTSVRSIVLAARATGSVAGVLDWYPHLKPADVAEALAFYEANRAEVDELIAANAGD